MSKGMLGVALSKARGLLNDLFEKLVGRDGPLWFAKLKLKRMLREGPGEVARVWRTVEIGRHKSVEAMVTVLEHTDNHISGWARDILSKTVFAKEPRTLQLVVLSVAELGFRNGATTKQIFEAGLARGLEPCPAEVGPALREQYAEPHQEWLRVAMEPVVGSDGSMGVFSVGPGGVGRWLGADFGHPDYRWFPGSRWVFVVPSER